MKKVIVACFPLVLLSGCAVTAADECLTRAEAVPVINAQAGAIKAHAAVIGAMGEYFAELEQKKVIPPFSKKGK